MSRTREQPGTVQVQRTSGKPGMNQVSRTREWTEGMGGSLGMRRQQQVGIPMAGTTPLPTEKEQILVEIQEVAPPVSSLKSLPLSWVALPANAYTHTPNPSTVCEVATWRRRTQPVWISSCGVTRSRPAAKVWIGPTTLPLKYLPANPLLEIITTDWQLHDEEED